MPAPRYNFHSVYSQDTLLSCAVFVCFCFVRNTESQNNKIIVCKYYLKKKCSTVLLQESDFKKLALGIYVLFSALAVAALLGIISFGSSWGGGLQGATHNTQTRRPWPHSLYIYERGRKRIMGLKEKIKSIWSIDCRSGKKFGIICLVYVRIFFSVFL